MAVIFVLLAFKYYIKLNKIDKINLKSDFIMAILISVKPNEFITLDIYQSSIIM